MTTTENLEENKREDTSKQSLIPQSKIKRALYYTAGSIFLVLGIIGIIFPILPTTPFLLLSAACYVRSSEKAYNWLIQNKIFGKIIRDYRAGKGISVKVKAITILFLWITIIISILFIVILWVQILLIILAILVSIHIILIKPRTKPKKSS